MEKHTRESGTKGGNMATGCGVEATETLISDSGKTVWHMDSEFRFRQMETNMKESGVIL